EAREVTVERGPFDNKLVTHVQQWGEQYRCCCFCGDRDHQLSISYLYGQRDETGRQLLHLAYCHRAKCLTKHQNRMALAQLLGVTDPVYALAKVRPGRSSTGEE